MLDCKVCNIETYFSSTRPLARRSESVLNKASVKWIPLFSFNKLQHSGTCIVKLFFYEA